MRWVQTTTRAVPGADGGHTMVTTLADVTGPRQIRAALARSETQFRLAMENAPIGMVLTDRQWRLVEVNAAFAQMLGVAPESLLGRDLSTLSHPGDRAVERAHVQQVLRRRIGWQVHPGEALPEGRRTDHLGRAGRRPRALSGR